MKKLSRALHFISVAVISGLLIYICFYLADFGYFGSPFFERLHTPSSTIYYVFVHLLIIALTFSIYLIYKSERKMSEVNNVSKQVEVTNEAMKRILKANGFYEKLREFFDGMLRIVPLSRAGVFLKIDNDYKYNVLTDSDENDRRYFIECIDKKSGEITLKSFALPDSVLYIAFFDKISDRKMQELDKYAKLVIPLLENARRVDALEKDRTAQINKIERYKSISKLIVSVGDQWTLEQTYWKIVEVVSDIFDARSASIIDVSGQQSQWKFIAVKNVAGDVLSVVSEKIKDVNFGGNLRVIKENKEVLYFKDVVKSSEWITIRDYPFSYIGIPIILYGQVISVLNIDGYKPSQFDEEDVQFAQSLVPILSGIVEKNVLLEQYNVFSITDPLTGLYNRRELEKRLSGEIERAKRYSHPLSIIELDLDNFKKWNDTYGHLEGDRLLKEFADIILKSVRSIDVPCRIGGDEFMVILPETKVREARVISNRIAKLVKNARFDEKVRISVSIGIAEYRGENSEVFFKRVDDALYLAKTSEARKVITAD